MAMEIEITVLPVNIRFEKICKNYIFKAIQMKTDHPIYQKISNSFPLQKLIIEIEININWDKYLDWNQIDQSNKKKYPNQLFKILDFIANSIITLNIEKIDYKNFILWQKPYIQFEILKNKKTSKLH